MSMTAGTPARIWSGSIDPSQIVAVAERVVTVGVTVIG